MTSEAPPKNYKVRPDGNVLFNPYTGGPTLVLTAEQHEAIRRLRVAEILLTFPVVFAGFVTALLGWKGVVSVQTCATGFGMAMLVCTIIYRYFKARQEAFSVRAPISAEQLPRTPLREVPGIVLRSLPDDAIRHSLFLFGGGSLASGYQLAAVATKLVSPIKPGNLSLLSAIAAFLICTPLFYFLWKERTRRKKLKPPQS